MAVKLSEAERDEVLRRVKSGESCLAIAQAIGRPRRLVNWVLQRTGGYVPRPRTRSPLRLSLAEREEISRALEHGDSCRTIARRLRRAPSSVSREVRRCGGREQYRAWSADAQALRLASRPKPTKIARSRRLRATVERLLALRLSPQQISHALVRDYPADEEMRVSHETIYRSLFVQAKGGFRKELTRYLRSRRKRRHPRQRNTVPGIHDMVPIRLRPAEAADRAVPGHWEGDLVEGARSANAALGRSAIATLVERRSRYTLLVRLRKGKRSSAADVRAALAGHITKLPRELRRSLTWDRGREMAEHVRFSVDTGVQVYFADPASPWQRGTNENTNRLARDYFPRSVDLSLVPQVTLDKVARQLNGRPRETLGWRAPAEVFAEGVGATTE